MAFVTIVMNIWLEPICSLKNEIEIEIHLCIGVGKEKTSGAVRNLPDYRTIGTKTKENFVF